MFDATKGQAAVTEQIEVSSDEFAARFSELQPRDQLAFLRRANELLESPEQVSAFQAGAFAQGAGQPALQLGGGGASAPTPAEIANAIKAYVAHTGAPREQENLALRSLLPDGDPAFIKATHGGEPAATVNLQNELKNTKDPKSIGSLAFELAQEKIAQIAGAAFDHSLSRPCFKGIRRLRAGKPIDVGPMLRDHHEKVEVFLDQPGLLV